MQFIPDDFKTSELFQFIITLSVIVMYFILTVLSKPLGAFETLIAVVVTYWFANALNGRKMHQQDTKIQSLSRKVDTQENKTIKLADMVVKSE